VPLTAVLKRRPTQNPFSRGLVVVVVVVIAAAVPYFLEFMTALFGLFTMLPMSFYSVAQLLFCFVNIPVAPVFRPRGQG